MASDDPWDAWRKRGFPFSGAPGEGIPPDFFAQFEKEFARMQGMIGKIMEDAMRHAESPQRDQPFVYGFSLRVGKDGIPNLTPFGTSAPGPMVGPTAIDTTHAEEVREPLSDLIEGEQEISVTVELPGVEKGDVSLKVTEESVTVRVDKGARRYRKEIHLPAKVVPKSAKATLKNSILDVTLQRLPDGRQDPGHSVSIE